MAAEAPSQRRSQPVRQARTNPNPVRSSLQAGRSSDARASANRSGPLGNQPIDIFPAITHFADTITALPKELVRHFTLLKEVDAKVFAPQEQLFKLASAATNAPLHEARQNNDGSSIAAPASSPMSAQNSSSGAAANVGQPVPTAASTEEANTAAGGVFDPSNIPRRQLFRQTAFKIQEMLVSLEEKNHVLSTANEALSRQLARIEDVWPHLENEFSDEAKWGSTTHWAYPDNRLGKHTERARRDGITAISAAAQALADEAAARSDARKQAVQAKRSLKNQHLGSDVDDLDGRPKKSGKSRKTADPNSVGLGIQGSGTNGSSQKRRKAEKAANGAAAGAMSSVFGPNASKPKTGSPRGTPAPDGAKKRKALPSGNAGQNKKRYHSDNVADVCLAEYLTNFYVHSRSGASPSVTSSPVMGTLSESKPGARVSPAPTSAPRPTTARARQNSIQSNADNGKASSISAANRMNGSGNGTPEATSGSGMEAKPSKDDGGSMKAEMVKREAERADGAAGSTSGTSNRDNKSDAFDRKREASPLVAPPMVTTKSGRASKPSTPALATFQEAAAASRARSSRNADGNGRKKKSISAAQALIQQSADDDATSSAQGDDEEEIDVDEPTYCYCNSVSYGAMVACDADDCAREWFHLACVGLKVAPSSKSTCHPTTLCNNWC